MHVSWRLCQCHEVVSRHCCSCSLSIAEMAHVRRYSQALTFAPKDATLYSNRSFSFLRLELTARAFADAEEGELCTVS